MRLTDQTRFPHPVLCADTDDFPNGKIKLELKFSESAKSNNQLMRYDIALQEEFIEELLEKRKAYLGLFISCSRTYYCELKILKGKVGEIIFNSGELKDRVVVRAVVLATQSIPFETIRSVHPDFLNLKFKFGIGDILGYTDEMIINVGLDKLAPMETIFILETNPEIPDGEIRVSLDTDKISIHGNVETCSGIHAMRNSNVGRLMLLNGVYLPAVIEVLSALSQGQEHYSSFRWYSVFTAKCQHLGIQLGDTEFLKNAQLLLHAPIGELLKQKEKILT